MIDADTVARDAGLGGRINTVLQTCFFAISGVLPREEAIDAIKAAIRQDLRAPGRRAWSSATRPPSTPRSGSLHEVAVPADGDRRPGRVSPWSPTPRRSSCGRSRRRCSPARGDEPAGQRAAGRRHLAHRHHAVREAEHLATEIAVWDPEVCIQCGNCAFVCPHA